MKTTQGKAVTAYITLATMARKQMPSFAAYKLFRLKKKLADIVEFQSDQEQKLAEELGGAFNPENGTLQISDPDKRKEYNDRHRELEDMECEIQGEKIIMTMKEMPDLSMADMETLDEFVEWRE